MSKTKKLLSITLIPGVSIYFIRTLEQSFISSLSAVQLILLLCSVMLTAVGVITLVWMLYAWENPIQAKRRESPKKYLKPAYTFSAIVPVRHEEKVIEDTVRAIDKIDYPDDMKEIIIVCRHDDTQTITEAKNIVTKLGKYNCMVLTLGEVYPINKPVSLNWGLKYAKNQIISIFDAEDEPHPDIYKIVNTVLLKDKVDIVQSGVQLMNYDAHWYSPLNVLEYYLWFKSGLHFFSDVGRVSFLGGNTVFFRKELLNDVGGWDETILTEDADIGLRLTLAGAKTKVIYDERHTTKEETPATIKSFIKQRTRWDQGFLQILFKGDWLRLPLFRQKLVSLYILLAPFFPIFILLYIPFGLVAGFMFRSLVALAMLTYIPFYLLLTIISVQILALREFTKTYGLKFSWMLPLKILMTYFPYVGVLTYSSVRAVLRFVLNTNEWEKTKHLNAHRVNVKYVQKTT